MRFALPASKTPAFVMAVALAALPAKALERTTGKAPFRLPDGFSLPELEAGPALVIHEMGATRASLPADVHRFLDENGTQWELRWDERNARPHLLQGQGVPLVPGRGNTLPAGRARVTLADVERAGRAFL